MVAAPETMTGLGIIEVRGWSAGLVIVDALDKAATIRLIQAELTDSGGAVCIKVAGSAANLRAAEGTARQIAEQMQVEIVMGLIDRVDPRAKAAYEAKPEVSPLTGSNVVIIPNAARGKELSVGESAPFAIGLIETQGFAAVIEAVDTACKAANVEIVGREKLGGGYITIVIKGDVAAVKAAVEAGKAKVDGLGKLIAGHVIARPSQAVLSLLPKT
ncbi:MAG: BMC domain-containing protein [Phycisphaeraceae bacterium]|nr:BMC domain-containing protein [Phycisphaeraceae bacterium]